MPSNRGPASHLAVSPISDSNDFIASSCRSHTAALLVISKSSLSVMRVPSPAQCTGRSAASVDAGRSMHHSALRGAATSSHQIMPRAQRGRGKAPGPLRRSIAQAETTHRAASTLRRPGSSLAAPRYRPTSSRLWTARAGRLVRAEPDDLRAIGSAASAASCRPDSAERVWVSAVACPGSSSRNVTAVACGVPRSWLTGFGTPSSAYRAAPARFRP
jgi:hypothetical protein